MRTIAALWVLLVAAAVQSAEPPSLVGGTTSRVGEVSYIDVTGEPPFDASKPISDNLAEFAKWVTITKVVASSPDGPVPEVEPDVQVKFSFATSSLAWDMRIKFVPQIDGVYVIVVAVNSEILLHRVEVGPVVPPQPPEPDPKPDPKPQNAPWESPGLTVLILRESQSMATLPVSQRAIFSSGRVHQWLTSHAVKLSDGDPGYRIWDDDSADTSGAPDVLRKAMEVVKAQAKPDVPIIGISNGKAGFVGPLPATIEETLKLLEAFK
jgi:hypothetical protein